MPDLNLSTQNMYNGWIREYYKNISMLKYFLYLNLCPTADSSLAFAMYWQNLGRAVAQW